MTEVSELLSTRAGRAALLDRDIPQVYRLLVDAGISQHQIARWTRQRQSEVRDILKGRQVRYADVLERICDGLGVPRGWMRLAYAEDVASNTAPDGLGMTPQEVADAMKRRTVVVTGSVAVFGGAVAGYGEPEPGELPAPSYPASDEPLPSRLGMSDVVRLEQETGQLRAHARRHGGGAEVVGAVAAARTRLLDVPATDEVKARLGSALSDLHRVAGACCIDSGADDAALHHCSRAVQIAAEASDGYQVAYALWHAGVLFLERGYPKDALQCFQLGQVRLLNMTPVKNTVDDPRAPVLVARLSALEAVAYADLERPDLARRELSQAHDGWAPPGTYEQADMDYTTALVAMRLGQLDAGEPFAAASARTFGVGDRVGFVQANTVLATIHVQAGESDGLVLARKAIDGVA
ncbi:MAG: hypothetical protein ACRDT0_15330, partial [Pseudonocardiaceae bacterium]